MFNTQSKIAKAVKYAIVGGALSTASISASALAQETVEEVERIQVTGSRITRTDMEGAIPVNVIMAEDIKLEGNFTVADALRTSTFNSFGSFSERSGSSAQSQATVNLRGAGSNRTLVLLDGKRLPGSPTLGGQSANLNSIPFAMVERIEILTDGASSTYGSDAIAGVVNIILKKNFEGLEVNIGAGHRDRDSGTTSKEFSVVTGISNDKGNITFAFDHQEREGISDGARHFSAARASDLNNDGSTQIYTDETDGWSWYGASVFAPDRSVIKAAANCDDLVAQYGEDTFRRMQMDDAYSAGSDVCGYAYGNVSYNKASIDRNSVFVDASYSVGKDTEWFGRAMFTQNKSFGRFAPPAAPFQMSYENDANPYGVSDDGYGFANPDTPGLAWSPMFEDDNGVQQYFQYDAEGVAMMDANGNPLAGAYDPDYAYQTTRANYRWVGIGTRDGNVTDYGQDYVFGFRGELDWNNASWETYYHRNIADNKSVGQYYLSYGGLAYNDANGIPLTSEEGANNMKITTLQESLSVYDQYFAGIGFDLGTFQDRTISHYVGFERQEISYEDIYDAQSEVGMVGGSAGNSSEGERDINAVFFESMVPLREDLELNVAVRYDDYSDFGGETSPKVSLKYTPFDDLVLRASYSEAFRAPGLDELNAATTFSAESAIDYSQGSTTSVQFDTYYKSNEDLGPETSEYINLGAAYQISDNVSVKLDYFDLSIDNVIQTKTVQRLLSDEDAGLITALSADADVENETFYLKRAPSGALLEAGTGYFNGDGFTIEGVDLTFNANKELDGIGDLRFQTVNSYILSYDQELGGGVVDTAGWSGAPEFKSTSTLAFTRDDHTVAWTTKFTDSTSEDEYQVDGEWVTEGRLDNWLVHNFSYTYSSDYGRLALTVYNVTDEDPVLTSSGQYTNVDLYNNTGRDYRASYTYAF